MNETNQMSETDKTTDHEKLEILHNQIELIFDSFMERTITDEITLRLIFGLIEIWKEQTGWPQFPIK